MLRRLCYRVPLDQNIFAAEFIVRIASLRRVAVRLHAVMEIENLSGITQCRVDFFFRPDIECAFCGLPMAGSSPSPRLRQTSRPGYNRAVGIFGGEKSRLRWMSCRGDVIENVARDGFILPILCDLKCVEIGDSELRLIIKHFFEMRHVPVTIDRVP
jgi:hypothetical protein